MKLSHRPLAALRGALVPASMHGEETSPEVVARVGAAALQGRSFHERIALYAPDGAVHWLMVDGQPLRDQEATLSGFVAVYSDFTALVEMEHFLTKQAQRSDVAMSAAKMGVWDWNVQTNQIDFDMHQFRLFGIDPADAATADRDWRKRVLPGDLPAVEQSLKRTLRGEGPYLAEFRVRPEDGSTRWLQGTGVIVNRDAKGRAVRVIGANIDVTARGCSLRRDRA
jgi:PAS domain S-box-containing protein